jgi:hypothetical protein
MRPFILFGATGAIQNPAPGDDDAPVIQDFRPANYARGDLTVEPLKQPEEVPQIQAQDQTGAGAEGDPKAPVSPATGSASDSETGGNEKSTPDSSKEQNPETTQASSSASSADDAGVAKAKLLHPSSTKTGKTEPPAAE